MRSLLVQRLTSRRQWLCLGGAPSGHPGRVWKQSKEGRYDYACSGDVVVAALKVGADLTYELGDRRQSSKPLCWEKRYQSGTSKSLNPAN